MIQDFFTTKIFTILFIMLSSYHLSNHNCINQWKYCKFFKMSMYGFWLAWSISHKMYSITCKKAWGYKIISNQFWGFTVHHKVLCKYFVFANIFIFKVGFQGFFFCLANLPYKRAPVEKYLALYESVNIIQNAKS